jgi:hypothetical protein
MNKRRGKVTDAAQGIGNALRAAFHEDATAEAGIEDLIARLDALPGRMTIKGGPKNETGAG